MSRYGHDNTGDGWRSTLYIKGGRAQVILEAAGKYSFTKKFIKVRDGAPQLLERGESEGFIQLPSSTWARPVGNMRVRKEIT